MLHRIQQFTIWFEISVSKLHYFSHWNSHSPQICDRAHTDVIRVSTSAPFHRRPRYHDTASQRTLASSKMHTGYFSTCMPACFHLLLMNHLAHTHSFMYTRSFLILKSREHVFLPGPYHLFPNGLKTQIYRKWNWSAVKFLWVFHPYTSSTSFQTWRIHLGSYLKPYWQTLLF